MKGREHLPSPGGRDAWVKPHASLRRGFPAYSGVKGTLRRHPHPFLLALRAARAAACGAALDTASGLMRGCFIAIGAG